LHQSPFPRSFKVTKGCVTEVVLQSFEVVLKGGLEPPFFIVRMIP